MSILRIGNCPDYFFDGTKNSDSFDAGLDSAGGVKNGGCGSVCLAGGGTNKGGSSFDVSGGSGGINSGTGRYSILLGKVAALGAKAIGGYAKYSLDSVALSLGLKPFWRVEVQKYIISAIFGEWPNPKA